jgi:hypothetical protein
LRRKETRKEKDNVETQSTPSRAEEETSRFLAVLAMTGGDCGRGYGAEATRYYCWLLAGDVL